MDQDEIICQLNGKGVGKIGDESEYLMEFQNIWGTNPKFLIVFYRKIHLIKIQINTTTL